MLTFLQGFRAFLRQCVYALTFFSCMTILAEWIVPGSVSPFFDPIPATLISLLLLVGMAMRRRGRRRRA